jgi:RNA polymerase sigma factor (sigma-70 family)
MMVEVMRRGDEVADVEAWVWRASFRIAGGLLVDRQRSVLATPDGPSPEEGATVEFLATLDGLSRQQREIVVLRYVGGFTPTEIADRIDSTPGAIRVQLHRAHQVLRGYVREETQGDH